MRTRKNGVWRQRDKLRRSRRGVGIGIRPPRIDQHVSAVGPSELLKCCSESCEASVPLRIALGESHQHATIRPLRSRRNRPSSSTAAYKCDEFPPPQGGLPQGQGARIKSIASQGRCVAAKAARSCPLRVISVLSIRRQRSRRVRFAPKADQRTLTSICPLSAVSGLSRCNKIS